MSATKPAQLRVRIGDNDMPVIEELSGRILTPPAVASMLIAAALEAIRANGGRVPFPPRFIVDTSTRADAILNDKPSKARK